MRRIPPRAVAALALALVATTACSRSAPAPRTYVVTIADMAFGPTPSGLRAGDTIEWVNNDLFQHSATARDGRFDVDLPPHAQARTVLTKPGVVDFYCKYHPGMTGRLVVAG
jgi:plastocyanin